MTTRNARAVREQTFGDACVEHLFRPLSTRQFLEKHWPNRPWLRYGPSRRLAPILGLPALRDLSTMLKTRGTYLSAVSPKFRSDQIQERGITVAAARRRFESGWTLTIGGLHEVVPELDQFLRQLATVLGLPEGGEMGRHRIIAYASPLGEALACHFDPTANFVIQIRGQKRWRIAPNRSVENPVDVYSTRVPSERFAKLASYCDVKRLPNKIPSRARSVVLSPGSVMFLPRGYWHETEALADSLSIHLVMHQPHGPISGRKPF